MVEGDRGPIEVNDFVQKTQDQLEKLLPFIAEMSSLKGFAPLIGQAFFGRERKQITSPDGLTTEVDWTTADLMEKWDQMAVEEEQITRRDLAIQVVTAMKHQRDFFFNREVLDDYRLSEQVTDFTLSLLGWVVTSKDKIAESYPSDPAETVWAAEALEIIRRTVLKPSYFVIEGVRRSIQSLPSYDDLKDFWGVKAQREDKVKGHMSDPSNPEEYQATKVQVALDNPKEYSEEDWQEILQLEMLYLLEYAKVCSRRLAFGSEENVEFASRLTQDGNPLFSKEEIAQARISVNYLKEIMTEVAALTDFDQFLPWIKQKWGEDATYQTFLDKLGVV